MMRVMLVVSWLLWAGCAAGASSQKGTTADGAEPGSEEEAGVKCREERVTGSNRTARVCRSEAERRRDRNRSSDMLHQQRPIAPAGGF